MLLKIVGLPIGSVPKLRLKLRRAFLFPEVNIGIGTGTMLKTNGAVLVEDAGEVEEANGIRSSLHIKIYCELGTSLKM